MLDTCRIEFLPSGFEFTGNIRPLFVCARFGVQGILKCPVLLSCILNTLAAHARLIRRFCHFSDHDGKPGNMHLLMRGPQPYCGWQQFRSDGATQLLEHSIAALMDVLAKNVVNFDDFQPAPWPIHTDRPDFLAIHLSVHQVQRLYL